MGEELGQAIEQVLGCDGMDSLSHEDWNIVQFLTYGIDQPCKSSLIWPTPEVMRPSVHQQQALLRHLVKWVPSPLRRMNYLQTGPHWVRAQELNLQRKLPEGTGE